MTYREENRLFNIHAGLAVWIAIFGAGTLIALKGSNLPWVAITIMYTVGVFVVLPLVVIFGKMFLEWFTDIVKGLAYNVRDLYDSGRKSNEVSRHLKSCVKAVKACAKLIHKGDTIYERLTTLSSGISKYGHILINEAATMNKVANTCSDQMTKRNLEDMAKDRIEKVETAVNKFQRIIPSILAGQYKDGLSEIESDLESMKHTIDKINRELGDNESYTKYKVGNRNCECERF